MKRRLTRAIKSRCLETEIAGLRDELKLVKERQVEEIAKLVDEQAIRNAEKYRLALILAGHNLRAISKAPLTISQAELVLMAKKAHDAVTNALKP